MKQTDNIKLSAKQKEVIRLMREGWKAENVTVNNESAFLFKNGGKRKVRITVFENLILRGLMDETHTNFAVTHFHLTELSKSINID